MQRQVVPQELTGRRVNVKSVPRTITALATRPSRFNVPLDSHPMMVKPNVQRQAMKNSSTGFLDDCSAVGQWKVTTVLVEALLNAPIPSIVLLVVKMTVQQEQDVHLLIHMKTVRMDIIQPTERSIVLFALQVKNVTDLSLQEPTVILENTR